MSRFPLLPALLGLAFAFTAVTSRGQLVVEIQYGGTINYVGGSTTVAELGDTYQAVVKFPAGLSPVEVWGEEGAKYRAEGNSPLVAAHYTINGVTYSVPAISYVDISVSAPELSGSDMFFFEAFVEASGSSGGFFLLQLDDPTRTALSGPGIPMSLNPAAFATVSSTLFVGSQFAKGTVDSFSYTTTTVPEPSTMSLLALAGVATGVLLRKKAGWRGGAGR